MNARLRLLQLMVARLGARELAVRLNVPFAVLQDWIDGHTSIPDAQLVAIVDLIDEA